MTGERGSGRRRSRARGVRPQRLALDRHARRGHRCQLRTRRRGDGAPRHLERPSRCSPRCTRRWRSSCSGGRTVRHVADDGVGEPPDEEFVQVRVEHEGFIFMCVNCYSVSWIAFVAPEPVVRARALRRSGTQLSALLCSRAKKRCSSAASTCRTRRRSTSTPPPRSGLEGDGGGEGRGLCRRRPASCGRTPRTRPTPGCAPCTPTPTSRRRTSTASTTRSPRSPSRATASSSDSRRRCPRSRCSRSRLTSRCSARRRSRCSGYRAARAVHGVGPRRLGQDARDAHRARRLLERLADRRPDGSRRPGARRRRRRRLCGPPGVEGVGGARGNRRRAPRAPAGRPLRSSPTSLGGWG